MEHQGSAWSEPFVIVPFLPPTSNHCYVTDWRRKSTFLTKEGKAFKTRLTTLVTSECLAKIGRLDRDGLFRIHYDFYFPEEDLLNATFGKKRGAETRYKRMDVENRLKLTTDSFAKAVGIDDCRFFEGSHRKLNAAVSGVGPQIHIFFQQADPRGYGL